MDYLEIALSPFSSFTEINQRVYWMYLWSSLVIAIAAYIFYKRAGDLENTRIFQYLFPTEIYFHRSAINDYLFFYSSFIFQSAFILPLFVTGTMVVTDTINGLLINNFEQYQGIFTINSTKKGILITFFLLLISDFMMFCCHYLQHKIPWLWEFHKVHHSAEVLTPISVFRMHPIDNILVFSTNTLVFGSFVGLFNFLSTDQLIYFNINGVNIFFIVFYFLAYNLRHSHIWISYGNKLNHLFMSPAQHQIHHSTAPKHFDKNLGFMFSIWDWLFNTLYVPKSKEKIIFGLGDQENKKFSTLWSLYLMPFINLFNNFKVHMLCEPKKYFSVFVFLILVIPAIFFNINNTTVQKVESSIYLQDMVWQEVEKQLRNGVTTVIIPTGGTEQNGPHVILGKHNYIVKYTAGKIAEKLGHTLVAPVITYVPEGSIEPADGHMKFAGTLSVTNAEFRSILESTARSLKQHGFKLIAFIGDSGGNQDDQAFIADKLTKLWEKENIKVIHVDSYYKNNQQVNYLLNNGYTLEQIGTHAGIRDTSELMAVFPAGVRDEKKKSHLATDFEMVGANGDASKASTFLGIKMLDLKIAAAVKQIKQLSQHHF